MSFRDGGTTTITVETESSLVHLTLFARMSDSSQPRLMYRSGRPLGRDHELEPAGHEEQSWVAAVRDLVQKNTFSQSASENARAYALGFLRDIEECPDRRARLGLPPRRARALKLELVWSQDNIEKIASAYLEEEGDVPVSVMHEFVSESRTPAEAEGTEALLDRLRVEHFSRRGLPPPPRVCTLLQRT